MREEGYAYAIYTILNPKNKNTGYSLLDIRLYVAKTLGILQEYTDLEDISNKEAVYTLPTPILVKHEIDIEDK